MASLDLVQDDSITIMQRWVEACKLGSHVGNLCLKHIRHGATHSFMNLIQKIIGEFELENDPSVGCFWANFTIFATAARGHYITTEN
jgi:hypothetical protein